MDLPVEFVSEPFDFSNGGVLSVEAKSLPPAVSGVVEFFLEGSEDKTCWVEMVAGTVPSGECVEVPYHGRTAPWGRMRLRSFGGDARVSVRGFGQGGMR